MNIDEIEQSLKDFAWPMGPWILELVYYREVLRQSGGKWETTIVNVLHFISNQVWKCIFGERAEGLEQSNEDEDVFFLNDWNPITNKYADQNSDQQINCAAFIAGIVEGILFAMDLPAHVIVDFSDSD